MTLLPHDNRDVKGLEGPQFPKYKVGPVCCVPGCSRFADHAHHLWRRSFLGGDFSWVELWDHTIIGNLVGLCYQHHDLVTQGKVWMRWLDEEKKVVWADNSLSFAAAILPQVPQHGQLPQVVEPQEPFSGPAGQQVCPGCKRTLPRAKEPGEKREQARRRKSWTITVPDDGEDGALVLDTLVEICRELFAHSDAATVRYMTVVQALALVAQHGHVLTSEAAQTGHV